MRAEHSSLAIDELGEVLAGVPALKRVLIFDTCHSGSAISLAGRQQNPFAFRGAIERFSRSSRECIVCRPLRRTNWLRNRRS